MLSNSRLLVHLVLQGNTQSWALAHTVRKLRNLRCALRLIFFKVAQFALRIYKAICALKNNRANCANSFRLFVKVLYL